jgi:hypothetical protein
MNGQIYFVEEVLHDVFIPCYVRQYHYILQSKFFV